MKRRQPSGSVLSLVSGVAFIIAVLGVAFFFIAKILGGAKELSNAADAGALNVAKTAITNPVVNVYNPLSPGLPSAVQDFFALADQPGSKGPTCSISLLTYNRTVAQAMIVASNAQVEGTTRALQNANDEILAAKSVGSALQNSFGTAATATALNTAFADIKNNLKMMGNGEQAVVVNPDGVTHVQSGFIKAGGSANVWFDPGIFSVPAAGQDPFAVYGIPRNNSLNAIKPRKLANGNYQSAFSQVPGGYAALYMAGYKPIPVLQGTPYANTMWAVPNEPQLSPHLVSTSDFNAATNFFPDASVPQNVFRIDCHAFDKSTKGPLNTTSCAVVGCTTSGFPVPTNSGLAPAGNSTSFTDYVAAIPAGYIRIVNLPDMNATSASQGLGLQPVENALYDGLHYIFNTKPSGNNLASDAGGGAFISKQLVYTNAPKAGFFVTLKDGGQSVLAKWAAYVNSQGSDGLGHNEALDPIRNTIAPHQGITPLVYNQNPNQPPPGYLIHTGSNPDQLATLQQVLVSPGIRSAAGFTLNSVTAENSPQYVLEQLNALLGNFGSDIKKVVGANNYPTVIEYLKALIEEKLYHATDQHSFKYSFTITQNFTQKAITGLKLFKHYTKAGVPIKHASPNWWQGAPTAGPTYPFFGNNSGSAPPTPMDLMNEINAAANHTNQPKQNDPNYQNFIQAITQRCRQMSPSITTADVLAALDTAPLDVTSVPNTLYLHLDLKQPTPKLVLTTNLVDNNGVAYDTHLPPDGYDPNNLSLQYPTYKAQYPLDATIIDVLRDGSPGALYADMNLEKRAYQSVSAVNGKGKPVKPGKALQAEDGVVFYPSSGYNNLLGEVHFFQAPVTPNPPVTVTWSQPN